METQKISFAFTQSSVTLSDNNGSYKIVDKNKDGHISQAEIKAALKGKDLDKASDELLEIFQKMGESKNKDGRALKGIQEDLRALAGEESGPDAVLKQRQAKTKAEKAKRNELKAVYREIQGQIRRFKQAVAQYKQQQIQQRQYMQQNQFMMSPMSVIQTPFGVSSAQIGAPFGYGVPGLFGAMPFGNMSMGGISKADLDEAARIINQNISDFNEELDEVGLSEEELLKDKGTIKIEEIEPSVIFEEEDGSEEVGKKGKKHSSSSSSSSSSSDPETGSSSSSSGSGKTEGKEDKSTTKTKSDKELKKEGREIAEVFAEEINDSVFDRDKINEAKSKITPENVMYVLAAYDKQAKDRNWKEGDHYENLWDGIRNEWSTTEYKTNVYQPIVDAMVKRAEQLGIDVDEDDDVRGLKNCFKSEYAEKQSWIQFWKNTDEDLVQEKFNAAYKRIKEAEEEED